jgi:DNA-binding NarL/FixJ family response regulator
MTEEIDNPTRLIHILLVNEIPLMGNVIATALEEESDIHIVACVTDLTQALKVIEDNVIDVALVSTRLPGDDAIKLTSAITRLAPATKVLALGLTEEKEHVLRYVEAGATGYVLQDDSLDDLIESVRSAQDGKVSVSPTIAMAMMERLSRLAKMFSDVENGVTNAVDLTPREFEVLELIGKGMTNQEIAKQLVIEIGTVKNHVHSILEKFNVSSRGEAAAYLAFINK